jgi:hypothetical protein
MMPAQRALFASQMAAAAQAAAQREAALRRRAVANAKLWEVAQAADKEGDLPAASRIYQRLALRRPATDVTKPAQERLAEIQAAADVKLKALEDQLAELRGGRGSGALQRVDLDAEKVTQVFSDLDALALEYAGVATVDSKIEAKQTQLRKVPQFAAILQEPTAAELWAMGSRYEKQQQACCAMQVYEQAAALLPAPSAKLAGKRLRELETDEAVVASARRCRTLQLCHENFEQATALKTARPERAREILVKIVEVAPPETSIHRAAREQLAMLK